MYADWGGAPAAGVVTAIGTIAGRRHMIVANDATVKAGAFFPMTAKKVLRAQRIAFANRLPLVYLVDSAGIFLPLQEEVFPDEDDFGRIFRNNAVHLGGGHSAVCGDHGQLRRRRRLSARAVRQAADDRGLGPVSGRAGAGERRDRAGSVQRRTGRRRDARADQRHDRLPRAGRRRLPRPAAAADRIVAAGSRRAGSFRSAGKRSSNRRGPPAICIP